MESSLQDVSLVDGSTQSAALTAVAIIGGAIYLARYLSRAGSKPTSSRRKPNPPPAQSYQKRENAAPFIEICVSDYESAKQAIHGGALSLELCSDRSGGGITPSMGLIEQCVQLVKGTEVELHVLIRPRPGDFVYSDDEFEIIQRDIIAAKVAGADGEYSILVMKYLTQNCFLCTLCRDCLWNTDEQRKS